VGQLDQFAKQTFAEETEAVTHGAVAWQPPAEIGLSDVRLDGLLSVRDPAGLQDLPSPWRDTGKSDEIVLEVKMPGDHLDAAALERALLRRQARQVQRVEATDAPFSGQVPLWMVAPHRPAALAEGRDVHLLAPGCYRVGPAWFPFLWIAANELPLQEALIPFLIARSGRALDDFARWVAAVRPAPWVLRMVEILPMSAFTREEVLRYFPPTDDPERRARRRHIARVLVETEPEVRAELREQGLEQGLGPLVHQFERRLGRRLTEDEHRTLRERLRALGPDPLGDVVLDLAPDALAAWFIEPAVH